MEIKTLDAKGVVTESGAYRIPMDRYHEQCCDGPSISSSGIRKIVGDSPWHFWAQSDLNPDRYDEKEPGDGLILGKATHCLVLGDEVFDEQFIYVPDDAPQRPTKPQIAAYERDKKWSEKAAPGAAFWEDFDKRAAGRHLLTDTQIKHIGHMAENVRRCPEAVEGLTGGLTEISMIWQDEATGVWIKSRPDVIPDNGFDFADLKTFAPRSKSIKRSVHQAITEHGYGIQMALATMGSEAIFGTTAQECLLVFVQSSPPYTVTATRLDEETMYWSRVLARDGINRFAQCLESGVWPMPVVGIMDYSPPPSLTDYLATQQLNGELPSLER